MMPDNEAIFKKLEKVEGDVQAHTARAGAFQEEVMNVLKGSFEGGKWEPGIAPMLRTAVERVDRLEAAEKKAEDTRMTWKHGIGFSFLGALLGTAGHSVMSLFNK